MAAYVIGNICVKDQTAWDDYRAEVGATITQYGGEIVMRGKTAGVFNGSRLGESVVILRFADVPSAVRWHDSADYQAIVPVRNRGADVTLTVYEE
jgi:uncharacterized protein (DUF1330 family)